MVPYLIYIIGMTDVTMMISIESELNDKLTALAKRNRRSKRMEVMIALDLYVQSQEAVKLYDQDKEDPAA